MGSMTPEAQHIDKLLPGFGRLMTFMLAREDRIRELELRNTELELMVQDRERMLTQLANRIDEMEKECRSKSISR